LIDDQKTPTSSYKEWSRVYVGEGGVLRLTELDIKYSYILPGKMFVESVAEQYLSRYGIYNAHQEAASRSDGSYVIFLNYD